MISSKYVIIFVMRYIFIIYLFDIININIFIYIFSQTLDTLELHSFLDIRSTCKTADHGKWTITT